MQWLVAFKNLFPTKKVNLPSLQLCSQCSIINHYRIFHCVMCYITHQTFLLRNHTVRYVSLVICTIERTTYHHAISLWASYHIRLSSCHELSLSHFVLTVTSSIFLTPMLEQVDSFFASLVSSYFTKKSVLFAFGTDSNWRFNFHSN